MKKSDTETMDEFNDRFIELSNSIPATYAPPTASTSDYYIEALSGKIQYEMRDKKPTTFLETQCLAIKIDKNMQFSGESNLPGYSRPSTPLKEEDPYKKQMMEMKERLEKMEGKHLAQIERMEDKHLAQMKEI